MNITARSSSTTTRAIRQCTGLRCRMTPSAETTASTARKTNSQSGMSTPRQHHHDRRHDQVQKPDRHQQLPPEAHQLVITEARQRPSNQDLQATEKNRLDPECEYA